MHLVQYSHSQCVHAPSRHGQYCVSLQPMFTGRRSEMPVCPAITCDSRRTIMVLLKTSSQNRTCWLVSLRGSYWHSPLISWPVKFNPGACWCPQSLRSHNDNEVIDRILESSWWSKAGRPMIGWKIDKEWNLVVCVSKYVICVDRYIT